MGALAIFLPWAAAISFAAFVGAGLPALFNGRFAAIYPYALGVSLLVGVPLCLWYRADRGWAKVSVVLAIFVGAVLLLRLFAGTGEYWPLFVLLGAAVGLVWFIPVAFCGLAALGAGALVLRASGEFRAIAQGTSVFAFPNPGRRALLLLLLTVFPPAAALALHVDRALK